MRPIDQRPAWALIIGVFLLFMLGGLLQGHHDRSRTTSRTRWPTSWLSLARSTGTIAEHPITTLMANAKDTFTKRLTKQSKTLPEAVAEYKRRYGRDPPRGFDHWWDFAKEHDFKLVDEFDAIVEDLAPFWSLSSEELRRRAYQVDRLVRLNLHLDLCPDEYWQMGQLPSIDLVRIQDGEAFDVPIEKAYVDKERGHRSLGFRALLKKYQDKVHESFGRHSGSDADSVSSYPTWISRSTRKQKVGCLSLGSIYNFPISHYKTPLVCTHRYTFHSFITWPLQGV